MMGIINLDNSLFAIFLFICFAASIWPFILCHFERLYNAITFINIGLCFYVGFIIIRNYYRDSLLFSFEIPINNDFTIYLMLNKAGMVFVSLLLILWPASYVYSLGYLRSLNEGDRSKYLGFLNLTFAVAISLALASNIISIFILYELVTLCTIPLIAHNYTIHVNKALKKYIIYLFGSSTILWLPAIIYIYSVLGISEFSSNGSVIYNNETLLVFFLIFFGIAKTSIFPFHTWLPAAMAANYPTSAVLHGVVVVNVGIFCLIKFIYEVFGVSFISELVGQNDWIIYIPITGLIYSGVKSVIQETIKKTLAWSTVSQLNFIILLSLSQIKNAEIISLLALLMHSFNKISLFFLSGVIYVVNRATRMDELSKTYKKFRIEFILFIVVGVNLVGLPLVFFGNFKDIILNNLNLLDKLEFIFGLVVLSLFSFIYIGRIIIFMSSNDIVVEDIHNKKSKLMLMSTIYTSILAIGFNIFIIPISEFLLR